MRLVFGVIVKAAEVNAVIRDEMAENMPSPAVIAVFRRKRHPVREENQVTHCRNVTGIVVGRLPRNARRRSIT